jgi:hypothetical protein
MSHHHILPPLVYVPQPKPKKIETRKSRIQMRSSGALKNAGDVEETHEPFEPGGSTPVGNSALENFLPIEGSEDKPSSKSGRLSESTLRVMLLAQETE